MLECTNLQGFDQIEDDHTGHNHAHSQVDSNDDEVSEEQPQETQDQRADVEKVTQALNGMMQKQKEDEAED